MPDSIRDNPERNRFELDVGGEVAFASYRRAAGVITLTHTEVPHALRGRGFGSRLARGVLEHVRSRALRVVPACGFVAAFIDAHPEFADLLASSPRAAARHERAAHDAKMEHAHLDARLDEALKETFPASDSVAIGRPDGP